MMREAAEAWIIFLKFRAISGTAEPARAGSGRVTSSREECRSRSNANASMFPGKGPTDASAITAVGNRDSAGHRRSSRRF